MQVPLPQSLRTILLIAMVCLMATGCQREASAPATPTGKAAGAAPGAMLQLPDFTTLIEKQGVAVVNVSTTQATAFGGTGIPGVPEDHPLYDFFRRLPAPPEEEEPSNSLGSGFIVSEEGHILTNAHVVDDALEVTVRLTDKREFKAKVIGSDRRTDIALLKIDAKGLPTVRIGGLRGNIRNSCSLPGEGETGQSAPSNLMGRLNRTNVTPTPESGHTGGP